MDVWIIRIVLEHSCHVFKKSALSAVKRSINGIIVHQEYEQSIEPTNSVSMFLFPTCDRIVSK